MKSFHAMKITAICILLWATAVQAEQLSYKYRNGETLRNTIHAEGVSHIKVTGAAIDFPIQETKHQFDGNIDLTVTRVDREGNYDLVATMAVRTNYDLYGRNQVLPIKQSYHVTMTPNGNVLSTSTLNSQETMTGQTNVARVAGADYSNFLQGAPGLPTKHLKVGEVWKATRTVALPDGEAITLSHQGQLLGFEQKAGRRCAVIDVVETIQDFKLPYLPRTEQQGKSTTRSRVWFAVKEGRVQATQGTNQSVITVRPSSFPGQSDIVINVTTTTDYSINLSNN